MTTMSYEQILQVTSKLALTEQLQLLEALMRQVRHQITESKEHSIMELDGLGAEIWQGIDAQAYVNEERTAWDS